VSIEKGRNGMANVRRWSAVSSWTLYLRNKIYSCEQNVTNNVFAGMWVPRGPKVHGRKYRKVEEWNGKWAALVSDKQLDTLNAELIVLHNHTQDSALPVASAGLQGNATVRPQPPPLLLHLTMTAIA